MYKFHLTYGIIIGILLAVVSFHAYTVYSLRAVVARDDATLAQVVNFLNQASQQQNTAVTSPAETKK